MGGSSSKPSSDGSSTSSDSRSATGSATAATTTSAHSSKTTASVSSTTSSSLSVHRHHSSSSSSAVAKSTTTHASSTSSAKTVVSTKIPLTSTTITLASSTTPSSISSPTTTSTSQQSTLVTSPSSTSYAAAAASTTATVAAGTSHHSGISSGALAAAIVIPVIVVLGLLGFLFVCLRRKRRAPRTFPRQPSPVLSGTTSQGEPRTPSADDGEKIYEKDMELTPIQRSAPVDAFGASASQPSSSRPAGLAPPTPVAQAFPLSSRSAPSSASSSPEYAFRSSPHHPSGSALLAPTLPAMDTGHFFDSSRGSTPHNNNDPFSDPRPGYTPSPIEHYHGYPSNMGVAAASSPTPVTYNDYSTLRTAPKSTSTPPKPVVRSPRANNLRIPQGLAPPPGPRTPGGESDHFSMMSDGEDDEADGDVGVVEYATAARVATVAQVVGGPSSAGPDQVRNNRQSVGLVTLGPLPGGSRSRPTSPSV